MYPGAYGEYVQSARAPAHVPRSSGVNVCDGSDANACSRSGGIDGSDASEVAGEEGNEEVGVVREGFLRRRMSSFKKLIGKHEFEREGEAGNGLLGDAVVVPKGHV